MASTEPAISVVPANEASWEDLQTIFGTRGTASRCQCQRYKLRPREAFGNFPVGTEATFAEAGFTEVSRPTLRRVVMRLDF